MAKAIDLPGDARADLTRIDLYGFCFRWDALKKRTSNPQASQSLSECPFLDMDGGCCTIHIPSLGISPHLLGAFAGSAGNHCRDNFCTFHDVDRA